MSITPIADEAKGHLHKGPYTMLRSVRHGQLRDNERVYALSDVRPDAPRSS